MNLIEGLLGELRIMKHALEVFDLSLLLSCQQRASLVIDYKIVHLREHLHFSIVLIVGAAVIIERRLRTGNITLLLRSCVAKHIAD